MKYSECNKRQKMAYRNIYNACNWLIGGLENTMLDNTEDSAEYKAAKEKLNDHEALVNELYEMSTTDIYDEGMVAFGKEIELFIRQVRFCGKAWLMERCEARVKKAGY